MKYVKKPIVIEAVQYVVGKEIPVLEFLGFNTSKIADGVVENDVARFKMYNHGMSSLVIKTLEGEMTAGDGDYIIKGVDGEFYPCKSTIFEKTYRQVTDNKVTEKEVLDNMKDYIVETRQEFCKPCTYVTVKMKNGFTIRESTTCVDPSNYDEEIGKRICLEKIEDKIWYLLGFLLQENVYNENEVQN